MTEYDGDTTEFVNPYTFVPFFEASGTPAVYRDCPGGHDPFAAIDDVSAPAPGTRQYVRCPERYSGTIDITWKTATPLLLPANARLEGWIDDDDTPTPVRIPGSSIKGAIRSVHEALFHGCLRVFGEPGAQVYRESVNEDFASGWRLAVVVKSISGGATYVQLCDEVLWVEHRLLAAAAAAAKLTARPPAGPAKPQDFRPPQLRTGDVALIDDSVQGSISVPVKGGPYRRPSDDEAANQEWWQEQARDGLSAILITDTATRDAKNPTYWATGRLTDTVMSVTPGAREEYERLCAGSRDRQNLAQQGGIAKTASHTAEVPVLPAGTSTTDGGGGKNTTPPSAIIATRFATSGYLNPGTVLWVRVENDTVTGMKSAYLWRREAEKAAEPRHQGVLNPCTDLERLCPSCATFGMIGVTPQDPSTGEHQAYAGHVRFGTAVSQEPVTLRKICLPPMGTPRPGAGGMYLTDKKLPHERAAGDAPMQWGSAIDDGNPRQLRGRKFYWHADPDEQASYWTAQLGTPVRPRYSAHPEQCTQARAASGGHTATDRLVVPAETIFTQRVTIDALDRGQVAALLAALDPTDLVHAVGGGLPGDEPPALHHHFGGGKPLGLGTVGVDGIEVRLWRGAGRYTDAMPVDNLSFSARESTVREAIMDRCGPFTDSAKALAVVLNREALGIDSVLVWYPPHGRWRDVAADRDSFDKSFAFFGEYSGERITTSAKRREKYPDKKYFPLPDLVDYRSASGVTNRRLRNATKKAKS